MTVIVWECMFRTSVTLTTWSRCYTLKFLAETCVCTTELRNRFKEALHRVKWSVSWNSFELSVARQVSRKVEPLRTSATVAAITVVIKTRVSPFNTTSWNRSHSVLLRYKERLRLYKRWPCSTYILNRVNWRECSVTWSARFLSHMNHVSVSPTVGTGPTQGQRKTMTRVGI